MRIEQRTPYHSMLVSLAVINLEMTSSSISCSQPLKRLLYRYILRCPTRSKVNRCARDHSLNSPWVFKSDERKGNSSSIVLQFNFTDFSIFVEEILNVSLLDIHGEVSDIDTSV